MSTNKTIAALLDQWEEMSEQGRPVNVEELCGDDPELLTKLKSQIEQLKSMDWLDDALHRDDEPLGQPPDKILQEPNPDDLSEHPVQRSFSNGRYELRSLIAEGGFAQVWRADDTLLQRPVAVKITTINCYAEARRVAQLKHHGIVAVHDAGNENGVCYIVFDLIDGPTLADRIREGPLNWKRAASIVAEVAESLQFAHERGFIHRDIKPSNIMINSKGEPILADFGIAVTECELRHEAVTSIGTLAYMAPEQLQAGGQIDVRIDVYGLGVVLYELLTGQQPFSNPTLSGLRDAILNSDPRPPRSLVSEVPAECERICLKCLSRNASDRYPTAISLAEDLKLLGTNLTAG